MNYRGSYRHLVRNSKAAMLAAIEIYNKPCFDYRDECFSILLLNAWELLLKAMLSKNKSSIFYPKRRKQPYRTLSLTDALNNAIGLFPKNLDPLPVQKNLDLIRTYRDNSVHFYNSGGFAAVIYALAQTNIINFRDLLQGYFGVDLANDITWQLLPLGLRPPVDPISYIAGKSADKARKEPAVKQFLAELAKSVMETENARSDTGRLLTIFTVSLQSTKKIETADILVGIGTSTGQEGPLVIHKPMDPNITHPLRQKEVLELVGNLHDRYSSRFVFQAVSWKYSLNTMPHLCWKATEGVLTKYSNDVIQWLKTLTKKDIEVAMQEYKEHLVNARKKKS